MSQPIDEAYVEVRPDVDKFATTLIKQLDTALKRVQASVDRSTARMSDAFAKAGQTAGADFGDGFSRNASGRLRDATDRFVAEGTRAGNGFGNAFSGSATPAISSLAGTLGQLVSLGPIPAIAGIAAAVPAVIALGGALADLSGALLVLPAGVGILAAAVAPLAVSFQGFGDAVKALATGDLEKINEAMKGLSPSARSVAREINALREPFGALKRTVQESLFAPLRGELTALAKSTFPTLTGGMSKVSAAFGRLGERILQLLGENDIVEALGDVFDSTARIITGLSPRITDLLGTLFGVMEHGLPFAERAFAALGRGLEAVTGLLSGSLQSGSFEGFIEDAFNVLKDLGDLAKSVFQLLGALFGSTGDEGRGLIQTLTQITDSITKFLESAEGQQAIDQLLRAIPLLTGILKGALLVIGALVIANNALHDALNVVVDATIVAGKATGKFFAGLGRGAADVAGTVGGFFASVGRFFADLGGKIADGFNAVVGFGASVVAFFTALPGRIVAGVQALPGLLLAAFNAAFDAIFYAIGFGIGSIVGFFIQLPGRIWTALTALPGIISTVFTTVRDVAIAAALTTLNAVVGFFTQLPGRVWSAITGVVSRVASVFNSARNTATSTASGIVSSVVGFFREMPGRVASAISGLPGRVLGVLRGLAGQVRGAGGDIIRSLIDGVNGLVDWAVRQAKRAVNKIVQGIKDALPGSPVKEGPLTVLNNGYAGRQIVEMLTGGIRAGAPDVRRALDDALVGARVSVDAAAATAPVVASSAGQPATAVAVADDRPIVVQLVLDGNVIDERIIQVNTKIDRASARKLAATPRIP